MAYPLCGQLVKIMRPLAHAFTPKGRLPAQPSAVARGFLLREEDRQGAIARPGVFCGGAAWKDTHNSYPVAERTLTAGELGGSLVALMARSWCRDQPPPQSTSSYGRAAAAPRKCRSRGRMPRRLPRLAQQGPAGAGVLMERAHGLADPRADLGNRVKASLVEVSYWLDPGIKTETRWQPARPFKAPAEGTMRKRVIAGSFGPSVQKASIR